MKSYFSVVLWLAACAATPLAAAQSSSANALGASCKPACPAMAPGHCASDDRQLAIGKSDARSAQPNIAPCDTADIPGDTSPWASYRPWRDETVGDWRQANALVGRIGGWRTYAREVAPPADSEAQRKNAP
jgi:hypothetical protein